MSTFHVEIIKPSHYDKDGYVIQWWKAWIPSNSMACIYAIAVDCARRKALGENVAIEVDAFDEMNIKIPVERLASRINQPGHLGLVCLAGSSRTSFRAPWRSRASFEPGASRSPWVVSMSAAAWRC